MANLQERNDLSEAMGPRKGLKVLDFTQFQNGPSGTVMLSDMGADVLKIERPGDGDPGRALGLRPDGFCGYFEAHDRGKRSMTVDLKTSEGIRLIHQLAVDADIVTENFRPGVMDRLGVGYEALKATNPQIIYAENSGFGPVGPYAERTCFDIVAQGLSGAMLSLGGGIDSVPVQGPWGLADQVGGIIFAYGIVLAVVARERFGVGQRVDGSQIGAMMTLQAGSVVPYLHTNIQPDRFNNPVFAAYQTSDDKWLTIGILTPKWWPALCLAIEREDLMIDERSESPFARHENRDWLHAELGKAFKKLPEATLLQRLNDSDVPCAPVLDYEGVANESQFWDNGYLVDLEHSKFENHRTVGIPIALSETPGRVQGPAPEYSNDTEAVLTRLGYDGSQIEELRQHGVI